MEKRISIRKVECGLQQIRIDFTVSDNLKKYFKSEVPFVCEYSEDIQQIPESIAVIPFICNVLPIVWLTDATLEVGTLDEDFYNSISEFKKGYIEMYPSLEFKGKIQVGALEKNVLKANKTAALFSGGVDAFATLIAHVKENPTLLTVWGADIKLDDNTGWNNVKKHVEETCGQMNLDKLYIKSNFRDFIIEKNLNRLVKKSGDGWWHGFQHGVGLLGLTAPAAYVQGFSTIYIASSFTIKEKGLVTCASDPTIDNFVRFCGTRIVHDQYEYARQEKIQHICEYVQAVKKPIHLRVCWMSSGGKNCCHCEKCYRTMFGLLAEGVDPKDYGFDYTEDDLKNSYKNLKYQIMVRRFSCVQSRFRSNPHALVKPGIQWIYDCDIKRLEHSAFKKAVNLAWRIKRKINSIVKGK